MTNRRKIALTILALAGTSAALWFAIDQAALQIRWRDETASYTASLAALSTLAAALFTMLAAIGAGIYVVLTYRLWQASLLQDESGVNVVGL